jgi:hypothetical protein
MIQQRPTATPKLNKRGKNNTDWSNWNIDMNRTNNRKNTLRRRQLSKQQAVDNESKQQKTTNITRCAVQGRYFDEVKTYRRTCTDVLLLWQVVKGNA